MEEQVSRATALVELVQLCPECRTSYRRPVAPGRKLCQLHLDNKRENQKTRRQRAKMRRDAEPALKPEKDRFYQRGDAPARAEESTPALPAVPRSDYAQNPPAGNPFPTSYPAIGPQQFRRYMHEHMHGTRGPPAALIQGMPAPQVLHAVPNNHMQHQLDIPWPQQSASYSRTWEDEIAQVLPSVSISPLTPAGDDSGYATGAYRPKELTSPTPDGTFSPPGGPNLVADLSYALLAAQDTAYPGANLGYPIDLHPTGLAVRGNMTPPFGSGLDPRLMSMPPQYPHFAAAQPANLPTSESGIRTSPEYIAGNILEVGHPMAAPLNSQFCAPHLSTENIVAPFDLGAYAGYPMQDQHLSVPVSPNVHLGQPSPMKDENVLLDPLGENQAQGSAGMPILATEQALALFGSF
ncbi:hypothetical protein EV426DRAFT_572415 [Tirmania nivea]|nr:hypothetical protein EV426DRAFT_572415 [Tirmania nivea]